MKFDLTIIGAGVVGLAIARQLSDRFRNILVVEKNRGFGQEISSRNSEVIHAGIYYPEGSLKARLCVEGSRLLRDLCSRHRIPHRLCGKLIVASEPGEVDQLAALAERARNNGVRGLTLLSGDRIKKMEPEVRALTALFSRDTGIIDSRRLMRYFMARSAKKGVKFAYQARVTRVVPLSSEGYEIRVAYPDGETDRFATARVVNAAGLEADRLAGAMGVDVDRCGYRQHFWKGEYFSVAWPAERLSRLVYPVPEPRMSGLGVHATIDMGGRIKLGPNAVYLPDREKDYTVDPGGRDAFYRAARGYLPALRKEEIAPEMAGIRPKLQAPGDPVRDFIIREESDKGLPGIVNLIGIESPGLTSCLAIARYVDGLMD